MEWFEHKHEVNIGEALGLLSAFQWVHDLRLGPIDFELDLKKYYENSSVEFVRRQANEVVHKLAKATLLSACFQLLVEPLDCIEHILTSEMI
ncbi:hypothetical protein MTR_4g036855 [Medicago truncatula]|uniref:RNase H type-1 domain-containing protein n=1 Tax=Medicago truncatula TaxID=3880 RepID=A0A072UI81_MEDTR|nr:hypothetical protein MTR_4g036855 [Medicago truncatula]